MQRQNKNLKYGESLSEFNLNDENFDKSEKVNVYVEKMITEICSYSKNLMTGDKLKNRLIKILKLANENLIEINLNIRTNIDGLTLEEFAKRMECIHILKKAVSEIAIPMATSTPKDQQNNNLNFVRPLVELICNFNQTTEFYHPQLTAATDIILNARRAGINLNFEMASGLDVSIAELAKNYGCDKVIESAFTIVKLIEGPEFNHNLQPSFKPEIEALDEHSEDENDDKILSQSFTPQSNNNQVNELYNNIKFFSGKTIKIEEAKKKYLQSKSNTTTTTTATATATTTITTTNNSNSEKYPDKRASFDMDPAHAFCEEVKKELPAASVSFKKWNTFFIPPQAEASNTTTTCSDESLAMNDKLNNKTDVEQSYPSNNSKSNRGNNPF